MSALIRKNSTKVFFLLLFLLLVLWAISQLGSVFILLLLSVLLTYLLSPVVRWLESRGVRRLYAISIIYISITILIVALLATYVPPLFEQVLNIEAAIKSPEFSQRLDSIQSELQRKFPFIDFGNISGRVNSMILQLADKWVSILTGAGSALFMLIVIPFVTFSY